MSSVAARARLPTESTQAAATLDDVEELRLHLVVRDELDADLLVAEGQPDLEDVRLLALAQRVGVTPSLAADVDRHLGVRNAGLEDDDRVRAVATCRLDGEGLHATASVA